MSKEKRNVAGYVRIALTEEELRRLDDACKLDERCRSDFVRIYAIRAAESLLQNVGIKKVLSDMQKGGGFSGAFQELEEVLQQNVKKKC